MESPRFIPVSVLPPAERDERSYVFLFEELADMGSLDPRLEELVSCSSCDPDESVVELLHRSLQDPNAADYSLRYIQAHEDVDLLPDFWACFNFSRSGDKVTVVCWNAALTDEDYFRYTAPRVNNFATAWADSGRSVWRVHQTDEGRLEGMNLINGRRVPARELKPFVDRVSDELVGRCVRCILTDDGVDGPNLEDEAELVGAFDPAVLEVGEKLFRVDVYERAHGDDVHDYKGKVEEVEEGREAPPLQNRLANKSSLGLGWCYVDPREVVKVLDFSTLVRLSVPYLHADRSHPFVWFNREGAQVDPEVFHSSVNPSALYEVALVAVLGSYVPNGPSALYFCFGDAPEHVPPLDSCPERE